MRNFQHKTLEQTIKELQKKYKNVPSPLSEQYQKRNQNINYIPQKQIVHDVRNNILGDFKPQPKLW